MTPLANSEEVPTEPNLERRTRRRFSAAEKQRLLEEWEQSRDGKKAWLRRNGLYAAQLAEWRRTLGETGAQGLEPVQDSRKAKDPRDQEIERLRRENAKSQRRAQRAEELSICRKSSSR